MRWVCRVIRRTLQHDLRCAGQQRQVREAILISEINRRARMQEVSEQHVGGELLGWHKRAIGVVGAAEAALRVEKIRIRERRVVIENQTQRQFLGELVVYLRAVQVVVKDALSRRKGRRGPARTRSEAVINQSVIKPEARGGPQRESEIHAIDVSEKWQNTWSRKKVF